MKMNQLKKKMIPLAMAMALVATGFAGNLAVQKTAFAEGAGGTGKTLIIKKVLTMPSEGVTTPDETFNFKFEAQSFNGNTNNPTQTCPAISNATAAYTTSGTQNDADGSKAGKQVVVATDDALKNVTWSKAGQYVYKVTEVEPNPGKAGMTYSKAVYIVSIFVSGTTGNFKVHSIQIKQSKTDGNEAGSGKKVEYNPTDPTGSDNNFAFENKYFPTGGNDKPGAGNPSDADKKGLVVSKKVADGAGASNTQTFKFSMNIAKPEGLVDNSATFTYVVVNGGGQTVGQEQTGNYGTAVKINLAHGDKVVLKNVHMGAKATVTETDSAGYTAKYKVTANGKADSSETIGTEASALLGDANGGNSIEFTNTQQTPTGVIIDNLPFIILVAIAGMGILFFVRNKRRAEEF